MTKQKPEASARRQTLSMVAKVLAPVAIGLAVVAWLFHREFSVRVWESVHFDARTILCIALAWVFMIGRDFGMTWRFHALTYHKLPWLRCLRVDMLCEFTSCVTPSAVGGSALGMVYLHREGIPLGRATTLMMTTLFMDELFFVVSLPIVIAVIPYHELFGFEHSAFNIGLQSVFWTVYAVLFAYTGLLFVGIILKPDLLRRLLTWLCHFRLLRRWAPRVDGFADQMAATGRELRGRPLLWWGEVFGGTALSWSSRYLVVNALFLGFAPHADQLVVFARQFIVWIVLMISPTPGGAGVSEWLFTTYYGDMIHSAGIALIIALFWRIISYYVYLVVGACIMPGWIRQGIKIRESEKKQQTKSNKK